MVTIKEIFELRKRGYKLEAYEYAKKIYASDKGIYASSAMFWTAVDILKIRVSENQIEEAIRIYNALNRLLSNLDERNDYMSQALIKCSSLIDTNNTRLELINSGPINMRMGIWGEDVAAAYLRENGYVLLERDWHSSHRDIDIIAQKGEYIVFVEVKTRRNRDFGDPIQAVDYRKLKNLRRAINHYLHYRKGDYPWRFDVITIVGDPNSGKPEINHIEDFSLG